MVAAWTGDGLDVARTPVVTAAAVIFAKKSRRVEVEVGDDDVVAAARTPAAAVAPAIFEKKSRRVEDVAAAAAADAVVVRSVTISNSHNGEILC